MSKHEFCTKGYRTNRANVAVGKQFALALCQRLIKTLVKVIQAVSQTSVGQSRRCLLFDAQKFTKKHTSCLGLLPRGPE